MSNIPAATREYLYVNDIKAFDSRSPDGNADPTTLPVKLAFITYGAEPTTEDWLDAEWASTTSVRILIGPGAAVIAPGTYVAWLRITGAIEQPERPVGNVTIAP